MEKLFNTKHILKILAVILTVVLLIGVVLVPAPSMLTSAAPGEIIWDFEDGTIEPFSLESGAVELPIGSRDTEFNAPKRTIKKSGKYYLNTLETTSGSGYSDGQLASFKSIPFLIYGSQITMKLAGGAGSPDLLYMGLYKASDDSLITKVSPKPYTPIEGEAATAFDPDGAYIFQDVVMDLTGLVDEGTEVYLKLVDNKKSNWAFIAVDCIQFSGIIPNEDVSEIHWNFENGTIEPFTIIESTSAENAKWISNRTNGFYNGPLVNKEGDYFFSTTDANTSSGWTDAITCVAKSKLFYVDVETNPKITFKVGGGNTPATLYVALYKASDDSVVKTATSPVGQAQMTDMEWDLSDTDVTFEDELYVKIVDNKLTDWGHITFDDFCFVGKMYAPKSFTSEEEVTAVTGYSAEIINNQLKSVDLLVKSFGDIYPNGRYFIKKLNEMKALHNSFWAEGSEYTSTSPEVQSFAERMAELEKEIAFENPYLAGSQMLFVTHKQYTEDHHNTHTMFPNYEGEFNAGRFEGGSAVKVLDFATGNTTTLLSDTDGLYRDPDISYDGTKLLLSYRQNLNDSYHIYEYGLGENVTSIASTKQLTSMYGADDMDPMYMPSGNIVFSSTRDPKYVQCNRHIAANIYRMESDGANILQITNNTLFDRVTDIMPDGRILYDRWEYVDRDFSSAQGLWTVCEDGTEQLTFYGNNTPTGATIDAKVIPGTNKVAAILSSCHDVPWGALAIIDRTKGVDGKAPVIQTWPASAKASIQESGAGGYSSTQNWQYDAYKGYSIKYEDPQPLDENFFLVSRQIASGGRMGIFLVDTFGNETLLYVDENTSYGSFDAVLVQPRVKENVVYERRDYTSDSGKYVVQNVYEGTHMQGVEKGTVKSLRIVEVLSKYYYTKSNVSREGGNSAEGQYNGEGQQNPAVNWHSYEAKRVIGEVPVYEDGSAYFTVPENTFVYFQLLDEEGRMIQSMRSGTLIQSGETVSCVGCHENRGTTVPDYKAKSLDALTENFEVVANPNWTEGSNLPKTIGINTPDTPVIRTLDFTSGTSAVTEIDHSATDELPSMNYLTEVQPIFTNNCLSCHGYDTKEGDLTLVPDKGLVFNASYTDLWRPRGSSARLNNLVGAIGAGSTEFAAAKSWGSYASPLVNKIFNDESHYNLLTDDERRRIAEWVDLNGTYYGDYCTAYPNGIGGRSPLSYTEICSIDLLKNNYVLTQYRFGRNTYGKAENQKYLIYFDNPEKSPLLENYTKGSDEYNTVLALIELGKQRLTERPDIDWKGLTAVPGDPSTAISAFALSAEDAWRSEKITMREAINKANKQAIATGKKRYDSDNTVANGLPDWPSTNWPGYSAEWLK